MLQKTHWKYYIPNWKNIRNFRKSRFVSSTNIWLAIVPISAKLLSKIEKTITIQFLEETFTINLELPFSVKALFFTALFYTLGNIAYEVFTPEIVKEIENYNDFIKQNKNTKDLRKYAENIEYDNNEINDLNRLIKKQKRYFDDYFLSYQAYDDSKEAEMDLTVKEQMTEIEKSNQKIIENEIEFKFSEIFESAINSRLSQRILCLLLYSIGSLCLLWIGSQNICFIINN